jgi:hypothetical protein
MAYAFCNHPKSAVFADMCFDIIHRDPFTISRAQYVTGAFMCLFVGMMWQMGLYAGRLPEPSASFWAEPHEKSDDSGDKAA